VGLGNPGAEYADTRHNAGYLLADALAERWGLPPFRRAGRVRYAEGEVGGQAVAILKPLTFVNRSGAAITPLLAEPGFDPARDLLILVDEAALPIGSFRLRARGTAGGHNGLKSVQAALRSTEYPRFRIGVGPEQRDIEDLSDFVLGPFTDDEWRILESRVPDMTDAVDCWITHGIEEAMNRYNQLGNVE